MADATGYWSPADNPYAIAVSEARWLLSTIQLAAGRLQDRDDPRAMPVSSRQIDSRHLVVALAQLLRAEELEQLALEGLGMDPAVGHTLAEAGSKYLDAVPNIEKVPNALTHFEDWSRGEGHGPPRLSINAGADRRQVARHYWGFGYDPSSQCLRLEPYRIEVESALNAATRLHWAIYAAATAVDEHARRAPNHEAP